MFRAIRILCAVVCFVRKIAYSESSLRNVAHCGSGDEYDFCAIVSEFCDGSVIPVLPVPPLLVSEFEDKAVCDERRGLGVDSEVEPVVVVGDAETASTFAGWPRDGTSRWLLELAGLCCGLCLILPKYILARLRARLLVVPSESDDLLLSSSPRLPTLGRLRVNLLVVKCDASFSFGGSLPPIALSPFIGPFLGVSAFDGDVDLEDDIQDFFAKSAKEDDRSLDVKNLAPAASSVVGLPASFSGWPLIPFSSFSFSLSFSSVFLPLLSTEGFSVPSMDLVGSHDRGRSTIDLDRLKFGVVALETAIGLSNLFGSGLLNGSSLSPGVTSSLGSLESMESFVSKSVVPKSKEGTSNCGELPGLLLVLDPSSRGEEAVLPIRELIASEDFVSGEDASKNSSGEE